MDEKLSYDDIAEKMFGSPFASLSAWGKASVKHVAGRMDLLDKKVDAPWNQSLATRQASLLAENERLAKLVEDLTIENHELWEENEQLRMQVSPSDSTS